MGTNPFLQQARLDPASRSAHQGPEKPETLIERLRQAVESENENGK